MDKEEERAYHIIGRPDRPSSIVRPEADSTAASSHSAARCRPRSGRRGPRAREAMDNEEERAGVPLRRGDAHSLADRVRIFVLKR